MKTFHFISLILCITSQAFAYTHTGKGTAYSAAYDMNATGQNMCEFTPKSMNKRWQVYYAAMNQADWNAYGGKSGICGKCLAVRGVRGQTTPGFKIKPIYVKIVDQCPDWACDRGNVDFSITALRDITGYGWDKKTIQWEFVDCPVGDENPSRAAEAAVAAAARAAAAAKQASVNAKKLLAISNAKAAVSAKSKAAANQIAAKVKKAEADLAEKVRIANAIQAQLNTQIADPQPTEDLNQSPAVDGAVPVVGDSAKEGISDATAVSAAQAISDKELAQSTLDSINRQRQVLITKASQAKAAYTKAAAAASAAYKKATQLTAKAQAAARAAAAAKKKAPFTGNTKPASKKG